MIRCLLKRFPLASGSKTVKPKESKTRRAHVRYDTDRGIATIRDQSFKIMNWSLGGLAIISEDTAFVVGQQVSIKLKFKLSKAEIEITVQGTVLRSYHHVTAFRFAPLDQMIRSRFQKVIDDERERQQANPKSK